MLRTSLIVLLISLLTGCAQINKYHNTSLAVAGPNPTGKNEDYLYEMLDFESVRVGYNLEHYRKGQIIGGYRLTIFLYNDKKDQVDIEPFVQLMDANDVIIAPYSFEQFAGVSSGLAGSGANYSPPPPKGTVRFSGTATNINTGSQYSYNGRANYRENAGTSFARGANDILVAAQATAGRDLAEWGIANWLLSRYSLPSGAKAIGTVFFPTLEQRKNPLKLLLTINGKTIKVITN